MSALLDVPRAATAHAWPGQLPHSPRQANSDARKALNCFRLKEGQQRHAGGEQACRAQRLVKLRVTLSYGNS